MRKGKDWSCEGKSSHFNRLVACCYPSVYSFAARLSDDPREAVALTCADRVSRKNFKCPEMSDLKILRRK